MSTNKKHREKEVKYLLNSSLNFKESSLLLRKVVEEPYTVIKDGSVDYYWHPFTGAKHDFIRVRVFDENRSELTLKFTDKGTIEDRLEINIDCNDLSTAMAFAGQISHSLAGTIKKDYVVLKLNDGTDISIYKVSGTSHTYLEIESTNKKRIEKFKKLLNNYFNMQEQSCSLYDIYFNNSRNSID